MSYAVLDVVYGLDVYRANLKLFPPLAKLCVPESNSALNELGITFASYYLLNYGDGDCKGVRITPS